jgi:hypothetical protein
MVKLVQWLPIAMLMDLIIPVGGNRIVELKWWYKRLNWHRA